MNHGHIQTDYAHHHLEERQHARKAVPCLYVYLAASFQMIPNVYTSMCQPAISPESSHVGVLCTPAIIGYRYLGLHRQFAVKRHFVHDLATFANPS